MFKATLTGICAAVILSTGCSITPEPLTLSDLRAAKTTRLAALTLDQEPVTQSISLYEAMARAIKYNLDFKVEQFEEALRVSELSLSRLEQLPDLVASAGFSNRDSYNSSRSASLLDGGGVSELSQTPTTSSERNVTDTSIRLSWDILDFGLSYVRAKQSADQVLIANERKRAVINRVIANVRTAYWRAVSSERLVNRLRFFEADITKALDSSERSYQERQTAPLAALTYQRELLEIKQQIQSLETEMSIAKMQLAALMNIDAGTDYTLQLPDRAAIPLEMRLDSEKLIDIALMDRPELREISYEQRINKKQANIALLEVLPNLSLFGGFSNNSNDFLYNNNWAFWGAQTSWNIIDAFKYPAKKRQVVVNGEFLDQRALALTMAVITQVHVSVSQFEFARRNLDTNRKFTDVNNNILDQIIAGHNSKNVSYQTFVRENMNNIVAEAQYDVAYAEFQNSFADIYTSIGQPVYGQVDITEMSVQELADHLARYWSALNNQLIELGEFAE